MILLNQLCYSTAACFHCGCDFQNFNVRIWNLVTYDSCYIKAIVHSIFKLIPACCRSQSIKLSHVLVNHGLKREPEFADFNEKTELKFSILYTSF